MTGHVRRRGERSWELKYDVGTDGKGQRKTRYASFKGTKREAEIELARLISQTRLVTGLILHGLPSQILSSDGSGTGQQQTSG
jgi:hypothetical protein